MISTILKFNKITFLVLAALSLLLFSSCSNRKLLLRNAPAGTVFTDEDGNIITKVALGHSAQLRNSQTNAVLFDFTPNNDINLTNLEISRSENGTVINFPSESDKDGLGNTLTLFVACNPSSSGVRFCPAVTSADDLSASCDGAILLTTQAEESGSYLWANATTRSGLSDCEVEVNIDDVNGGAQGTIVFSYSFSFLGPDGIDITPETAPDCLLACDDPTLDAGGVSGRYACNDPAITGPTEDISGTSFSCQSSFEGNDQNFVTNYLTRTPSFTWTFLTESIATLDLANYNFLLSDEENNLVACEFQCEAFIEGEGSFEFTINDGEFLTYTVTGYDTDNTYFVDPDHLDPVLAGIDGGPVGVDTLVITDSNDNTDYSFTLGTGDFEHVTGFEIIDLDNGVVNSIFVDADSLLATSDTASLLILGTELDSIGLVDTTWEESATTVEINGVTCNELTNGEATLYLQEGITWGQAI
ncbi:hypothetical protein K1X76_11470 [bacterium]|nr:hypothetical protein [bacterium]